MPNFINHALNETERQKIVHALYVAAERFEDNAKTIRTQVCPESKGFQSAPFERLALQFDIQAEDSRRWAELIENAEHVIVTPAA